MLIFPFVALCRPANLEESFGVLTYEFQLMYLLYICVPPKKQISFLFSLKATHYLKRRQIHSKHDKNQFNMSIINE